MSDLRPRLLDLCCGAGGAAHGYRLAGWHVTGVDLVAQPNYCGDVFVQADALEYLSEHGRSFDAIHASWPCEKFANVTGATGDRATHPDLVTPGRPLLVASGRPWVIENVPEAPIRAHYLLCGSMFGLHVRRHRAFETSWSGGPRLTPPCWHHRDLVPFDHSRERAYADAMGCTWMTNKEARKAIPPAYTHHIGTDLIDALTTRAREETAA
ncbi:class I SAM-dependent methyltransferase [Embleya scabrispora]|uniref:class I SAM-dependent methyltransferase n=1 Tax=Embleya scabrispora TaxID=159449 RepID=UPI000C7A4B90|nr:DNA cytosine methyltransferase [Embleya scabrispora]